MISTHRSIFYNSSSTFLCVIRFIRVFFSLSSLFTCSFSTTRNSLWSVLSPHSTITVLHILYTHSFFPHIRSLIGNRMVHKMNVYRNLIKNPYTHTHTHIHVPDSNSSSDGNGKSKRISNNSTDKVEYIVHHQVVCNVCMQCVHIGAFTRE